MSAAALSFRRVPYEVLVGGLQQLLERLDARRRADLAEEGVEILYVGVVLVRVVRGRPRRVEDIVVVHVLALGVVEGLPQLPDRLGARWFACLVEEDVEVRCMIAVHVRVGLDILRGDDRVDILRVGVVADRVVAWVWELF